MKEDTRTNKTDRTYADKNMDTRARDRRATGSTNTDRDNPYLARLKDLKDYKVASDDPDVRGWTIVSGDNENIGKVDELIVDTKRMKVRYLVVDVAENFAADKKDHYMLVPIGAARLHEKNNDVIVSGITTRNTSNYPVYRGDTISRNYENSIRRFYEAGGTVPSPSASESITEHETIRDAHTGKIYERKDENMASDSRTAVDSNNRNRVDVVTGTSGDQNRRSTGATGTGDMSNLPQEDRMKDRDKMSSNTMRGDRTATDRRPDSNTAIGSFNHTSSTDIKDRVDTSGISSSRTSNLPNKELRQGPASSSSERTSEEDRVRIHDTDPNVPASDKDAKRGDFNETGDLNRSTSLGNDSRRGSNMGNLENRAGNPGLNDRERMSSPEFTDRTSTPGGGRHPEKYPEGTSRPVNKKDMSHSSDELPDDRYDPSTDEFYTHDHFDEERFYGNRRNR